MNGARQKGPDAAAVAGAGAKQLLPAMTSRCRRPVTWTPLPIHNSYLPKLCGK
jgi:hypothetical protein